MGVSQLPVALEEQHMFLTELEGPGEMLKMYSLAAAIKLTCLHSLVLEKGSVRQGHQCVRKMVMQALASDKEGRLQLHLVVVGEGAAHLLGPLEPEKQLCLVHWA